MILILVCNTSCRGDARMQLWLKGMLRSKWHEKLVVKALKID
jgi:hypothetical protein